MKELLDDINRWRLNGERIAVARVVDIEGSGPRLPGARGGGTDGATMMATMVLKT